MANRVVPAILRVCHHLYQHPPQEGRLFALLANPAVEYRWSGPEGTPLQIYAARQFPF